MQVSRTNELKGGRGYHSIGRIKASSGWRASDAHDAEEDRLSALWALISEAQEFDADAIVGLDFEIEAVTRPDFDGAPLQRTAAIGNCGEVRRSRVIAHRTKSGRRFLRRAPLRTSTVLSLAREPPTSSFQK